MGWQDDLRDVVEQRGDDLQQVAADRLSVAPVFPGAPGPTDATDPSVPALPADAGHRNPDDPPDDESEDAPPVLDPAVVERVFDDAIVTVFVHRARTAGPPPDRSPGVRIVVGSHVDELADAVQREIEDLVPLDEDAERDLAALRDVGPATTPAGPAAERLAPPPPARRPRPRATRPLTPPRPPRERTPDLVARVRARRRARLLRAVAVGAAVALVAGALCLPLLRDDGPPAVAAPDAGPLCPARLGLDKDPLVPVTLDPVRDTVVSGGTWTASYRVASGSFPVRAGDLAPSVWLTSGDRVVGLGNRVEPSGATEGATSDTKAGRPGTGTARTTVRFASCATGDPMPAGPYQAVVSSTVTDTEGRQQRLVSEPVGVTVISTVPDGAQPEWLAGSPLACGESVTDLVVRTADVDVDGLSTVRVRASGSGLDVVVRNDGDKPLSLGGPAHAVALWVQDGRVVGVGADDQQPGLRRIAPGGTLALPIPRWDVTDYCRSAPGGEHPFPLEPGVYQVVPYARYIANYDVGVAKWYLGTDDATTVLVTADHRVEPLPSADATVAGR
ncbi:hypothetical protein [Luteimicrobium subarcticum]|uniref:Uncharacterized protein n=1 Tax=Luteimicrobium subarcticum TaxID=620910 RepID=A0A2M8WSI3_9MICO|nr:hypothetical protein [Luteimicrobium subarcticum]PJI93878.1 hypothetical protein CLV34_1358 [Luteimicrobium subarcticum]